MLSALPISLTAKPCSIAENSAAAKAGIKVGDVITRIEDKDVKNDIDLINVINAKKQGDVQLTIVRDKASITIPVTPEVAKDGLI